LWMLLVQLHIAIHLKGFGNMDATHKGRDQLGGTQRASDGHHLAAAKQWHSLA